MHCTCVRQTELPSTSRLFADVLYHPDRTASYYAHPLRSLESYQAAAAAIALPDDRRAALVAALRIQNPNSPSLDRMAQPGTVAVVTGQQVGLFCGPAYTIYKALHAAKLARWLTEQGIPAVPVFWLATEDHDFEEVNHAWIFNGAHQPSRIAMRRSASTEPVGQVVLVEPPIDELRQSLNGLPFAEEVASLAARAYRPGHTMGQAFSELLRGLLPACDILQADPMLPAFRALAAPAIRKAVECAPDLTRRVLARNKELLAAGYHAQVHVEEQTSFYFLLEEGKRLTLRRHGNDYLLKHGRLTTAELMERADHLSPNALLRPVVQDSILPTVAYIGGPAETAYLAQSSVIYEKILGRMPVAVPRSGFTVLDERSQKLMERYGLSLPDFFAGEDPLRERIAARLVPPSVKNTMKQTLTAVDSSVERLRKELLAFDPTLAQALERSERKIRYQFGKVERKVGREAMRRDARVTREATALYNLVYPERHLQERLYSILPFVAQHGLGLVEKIGEALELDCPDHRLMVV